jgi:bifunctional non-homologous end joining protein LigD
MISAGELEALPGQGAEIEVCGRTLRLTNLDKIMWPETATTKRELLAYYLRIAPVLLPHVRGRALTLARYPDGVDGVNWFQTSCPRAPAWLRTHAVPGTRSHGRRYCVVDDVAGLLWVANLGSIELHPLLSVVESPGEATAAVFDLDPGARRGIRDCCEVAVAVRARLRDGGLSSIAKTSGALGLHVWVPLNSGATYARAKRFVRSLARDLSGGDPERVTDRMEVTARTGKIFVDWSQNDPNKSLVAPYSLRAMPWPVASAPLRWAEVEAAAGGGALPLFDAAAMLKRVEAAGDLFAPALELRQSLP